MKFLFLSVVLFLLTNWVYAQSDTITKSYFVNYDKDSCDAARGFCYRKAIRVDGIWLVKDYYVAERSLQMEGAYIDDSLDIPVGIFRWYHENKQLKKEGKFTDGKKDGIWKRYNEGGLLVDSSLFLAGNRHQFSYAWHDGGEVACVATYNDDGSGREVSYHSNGKLDHYGKYSGHYQPDSVWVFYYENGNTASKEYFDKGILLKIECFNKDGKSEKCIKGTDTLFGRRVEPHKNQDEDLVFDYSEKMPSPSFNLFQYLGENVRYPQYAMEHNIDGTVLVSFYVDLDGKVNGIKLFGSGKVGGGIDEEALRVVKAMPRWFPGRVHHRPVKVLYTLPVSFKIN